MPAVAPEQRCWLATHCAEHGWHQCWSIREWAEGCRVCRRARERRRADRTAAVRKPPRYQPRPGCCSLCGVTPLPPRCRTWCHDCPKLWAIATSSDSARRHLIGLHGHACWECGADWRPGQQDDHDRLGHVYGGHPIRQVGVPGGRAGNPRDRVPAPDGWITAAWCEWPGPVHGPPEPRRVPLAVDHVRPLWSLTDEERTELRWWLPFNLQLLCDVCHAAKTKAEASERARLRRATVAGAGP